MQCALSAPAFRTAALSPLPHSRVTHSTARTRCSPGRSSSSSVAPPSQQCRVAWNSFSALSSLAKEVHENKLHPPCLVAPKKNSRPKVNYVKSAKEDKDGHLFNRVRNDLVRRVGEQKGMASAKDIRLAVEKVLGMAYDKLAGKDKVFCAHTHT